MSSNKHKIIFIGGVHGIGKTTFCRKIIQHLPIRHYSASDLITRVSNLKHAVNKHTEDINSNQDILMQAISCFISNNEPCLLDGHFCLLNQSGELNKIPLTIFREIGAKAIIVLKDKPMDIVERIDNRDGLKPTIDTIADFQEQELKYSRQIAESLNTPYMVTSPTTGLEEAIRFIQRHLGSAPTQESSKDEISD